MYLILFLCFTGVFLVSATLQVIGYCRRIAIIDYISKPMMYAFLIAAAVFALIPRLPDSFNILFCTCFSLGLGMATSCLLFAPKRKRFLITSMLCFILSSFGWLCLIWPSFRLFTPNPYITTGLIILYLTALALFIALVIGNKGIFKISCILIYLLPILLFHYAAVLTVLGQPKLYSFILTAGSTSLLVSQGFIVKAFFKKASPSERFARTLIFVFSQLFITAGFILMISL